MTALYFQSFSHPLSSASLQNTSPRASTASPEASLKMRMYSTVLASWVTLNLLVFFYFFLYPFVMRCYWSLSRTDLLCVQGMHSPRVSPARHSVYILMSIFSFSESFLWERRQRIDITSRIRHNSIFSNNFNFLKKSRDSTKGGFSSSRSAVKRYPRRRRRNDSLTLMSRERHWIVGGFLSCSISDVSLVSCRSGHKLHCLIA